MCSCSTNTSHMHYRHTMHNYCWHMQQTRRNSYNDVFYSISPSAQCAMRICAYSIYAQCSGVCVCGWLRCVCCICGGVCVWLQQFSFLHEEYHAQFAYIIPEFYQITHAPILLDKGHLLEDISWPNERLRHRPMALPLFT